MGFFDRLYDCGDREWVKTYAIRIGIGLQQIEAEVSPQMVGGLCDAIRNEVQNMRLMASKLSNESLSCLNVKYKGQKIPYFTFLQKIKEVSDMAIKKGGCPLL